MSIYLMSIEEAQSLKCDDYIYDSKNRKVKVISKYENTLFIERYMTEGTDIVLWAYKTYKEIATNYTIHAKETSHDKHNKTCES